MNSVVSPHCSTPPPPPGCVHPPQLQGGLAGWCWVKTQTSSSSSVVQLPVRSTASTCFTRRPLQQRCRVLNGEIYINFHEPRSKAKLSVSVKEQAGAPVSSWNTSRLYRALRELSGLGVHKLNHNTARAPGYHCAADCCVFTKQMPWLEQNQGLTSPHSVCYKARHPVCVCVCNGGLTQCVLQGPKPSVCYRSPQPSVCYSGPNTVCYRGPNRCCITGGPNLVCVTGAQTDVVLQGAPTRCVTGGQSGASGSLKAQIAGSER